MKAFAAMCLNRSSCKQRGDNVPFSRSQQPLLCFQDYISLPCQSDNEILITTEQLSDCRKWRHQHPPKIQLGNSFKRRIFCLFLLSPTVIFFLLRKMTAGVQCFFYFSMQVHIVVFIFDFKWLGINLP